MANAFTAVADDAGSALLNPAGLSQLHRPEATAMYGRLLLGLSDGSELSDGLASFAMPLPGWGTAAFSWHQLQLTDALTESTFGLAYGRSAGFLLEGLSVGGGAKLHRISFDFKEDPFAATDPLFLNSGSAQTALSLDAGLLYRRGSISFGLSLLDLNEPDVGLASESTVPRQLRLGAAYRVPNTTLAVDLVRKDGETTTALGGEFWWQGRFGTRGGFEIGSSNRKSINAGLSFRFSSLQADYAFHLPIGSIQSTQGSHRFGITARFGAVSELERSRYEGEMTPAAAEEMNALRDTLDQTREELDQSVERGAKLHNTIEILQEEIRKSPPPDAVAPSTAPERGQLDNQLQEMKRQLKTQQGATRRLRRELRKIERPPAARPAPRPAAKPRPTRWTVREGDTLQSIAVEIYGDKTRWDAIYKANPGKFGRGGQLTPGTTLEIP